MKIYLILIVLDFTQICNSLQNSISIINDVKDNITLFRDKRQIPEYTRWQANLVVPTKREFIVKVEDEVYNPSHPTRSTPIVGINIQSTSKGVNPIVIGGAIDPPGSTPELETTPVEYTRFVPPAIVRSTGLDDIARPQLREPQGPVPPFSVEKHANRDESPPAGPHFITRSTAVVQQFVPITPVAFQPRVASPDTPPNVTQGFLYSPRSRTTTDTALTRTREAQDLKTSQSLSEIDELKSFLLSKYHYPIKTEATGTSLGETAMPVFKTNVPTWNEDTENPTKQTADIDLESYHLMFYNEDYNGEEDDKKKTNDKTQTVKYSASDVTVDSEEEAGLDIEVKENNRRKYSENFTKSITNEKLYTIRNKPKTTVFNNRRRQTCSLIIHSSLRFNAPLTLPEIVLQLKKWSDTSAIANLVDITASNLTTMDNPIYMMKVDDPSSGQIISAKDVVMIVAGIQGRDHHAVSAAMYVLYQLIDHTDAHTDLLKKFRFWIIPVFNPDGYDYSITFSERRNWKKNLHQSWTDCPRGQNMCKDCKTHGLRCVVQTCYGVHLDRNFEYQWMSAAELRAEHPCGDLYAGSRQLSEPETRALTTFLHEQKVPLSMFVAFKEGDVLGVMYPYSHTRKKRAFDVDYRNRAARAASAAFTISGRPYVAGQTSEFLPLYAGGIEDWIDGHLGIDNSYSIMMFRPSDTYNANLMTEHVVHEAYAALDTLLLETTEKHKIDALQPRASDSARVLPTVLFLSAAIIFDI